MKNLKVMSFKITMEKCRKCNGNCKPSKAFNNTLVLSWDFDKNDYGRRGTTQSRVGKATLVECMKCEDCGHSFIPTKSKRL